MSVLLNTTAAGAATALLRRRTDLRRRHDPIAVAAADFNGDGRPDFVVANQTDNTVSVLRNTTTPFANPVPVAVADFTGQGVWEYSRVQNTWIQLNAADASLLAINAAGDVAAVFPGVGVLEYLAVHAKLDNR